MTTKNYDYVKSIDELEELLNKIKKENKPFAFDIETGYAGDPKPGYSLHPETAFVVGISFTNSLNWARYVPLRHDEGPNLDSYDAARLFWSLLQTGLGIAHQAGFELRHLSKFFRDYLSADSELGDEVRQKCGYFPLQDDTMLMAYCAAEHPAFGLKYLTKEIFNHQMIELIDLFDEHLTDTKKKTLRFNILPLTPKVVEYACEDSLWALAHRERYIKVLDKHFIYQKVEKPNIQVVAEMEDEGIEYDWPYLSRAAVQAKEFQAKVKLEIEEELEEIIGKPISINLNSPKQMRELLYENLGVTPFRWTKGSTQGKRTPSTDAITLQSVATKYPIVKKVIWWKELSKLLGSYLNKYERDYGYAPDGRVHPNHLPHGTVSGRFSVADPNYQQTPKKYFYELKSGEIFSFDFRKAIRAPRGWYMLGFDLSQAELRVIAGEAQEPEMIKAFEQGIDIHSQTAALMLGIPVSQIGKDSDERKIGKNLNFSLVFQLSPKGLAERLLCSQQVADAHIENYFGVFSRIKPWQEKQIALARKNGYIITKFGRKVPIWEYKSDKPWIQAGGDRLAGNAPVQGPGTGDLPKMLMIRCRNAIRKANLQDKIKLVMNIHDALEFYVHESLTPKEVLEVLRPAVDIKVPGWPKMEADWHMGPSWGELSDIDEQGNLLGKDKDEKEEAPENDEESGQIVEIDAPVIGPKKLVIVLKSMPDTVKFRRFVNLADSLPGQEKICVRTPAGDLDLPNGTSLSAIDEDKIQTIFQDAELKYESVDAQVECAF